MSTLLTPAPSRSELMRLYSFVFRHDVKHEVYIDFRITGHEAPDSYEYEVWEVALSETNAENLTPLTGLEQMTVISSFYEDQDMRDKVDLLAKGTYPAGWVKPDNFVHPNDYEYDDSDEENYYYDDDEGDDAANATPASED